MGQLIRLRIRTLAAVSLWPQTPLRLFSCSCSCVDNPLRGKRGAVGGEGAERRGRQRGKAESELEACQTIRRRKIYRRAAASLCLPPQLLQTTVWLREGWQSELEEIACLTHPLGQRGRCPLLCHRSNLSERMINCWKITCIKRPKRRLRHRCQHRLRHRLQAATRSWFRKFMLNNLMLSPRGLLWIFMMRH